MHYSNNALQFRIYFNDKQGMFFSIMSRSDCRFIIEVNVYNIRENM